MRYPDARLGLSGPDYKQESASHMRSRKLKMLEKNIDRYAAVIEAQPAGCAGRWAQEHMPQAREVRLDLGCGKGSFTARMAAAEPDVLFIGLDRENGCVAAAARIALRAGVRNVIFAQGDAADLPKLFAPGELDCIYLNFCTPFPPAKQAPKRLTHVDHLLGYRDVLAPGASVRFKTDHVPLFEFSRIQFGLAGYETLWETTDLHAFNPGEVMSDYEELLVAKGAVVHALEAKVGPHPEQVVQTAPLGLVSYLPSDLDSLDYIPYGMEMTVFNLKNRAANEQVRRRRVEAAE